MKGLPCPGLCPAHFCLLGSCFMAEGSGARALGRGPPLSIQYLRAQYEDLRQQQRAQAHCVVLPKGGNTPAPAEPMVSAVWINKERRPSLAQDKGDPEAAAMREEADGGSLQVPGCPWHTHLQMHCAVQSSHQDASRQAHHHGLLPGAEHRRPRERDSSLETTTPEAAQHEHRVDNPQTRTVGSGLHNGLPWPSPTKSPQRPGKPAHYPFPQRKTPRISQAARNLGLYGPP